MTERLRVSLEGLVQGVGFRPFVHNLAVMLNLSGWVRNTGQGVVVEVEGSRKALSEFLTGITSDPPTNARILHLESVYLDPVGYSGFAILPSTEGSRTSLIPPDLATCRDCLAEIFDPDNRRYRYPFTNCTHCGPRYTILRTLPYDRPNTSMAGFTMCPACREEYENPADRRFHAQPNACPVCGPQVFLWDREGREQAVGWESIRLAAKAVHQGEIVAIKGLGGFHLLVDADNPESIARLRARKHREEKPFAVLMPTLAHVESHCRLSAVERHLLESPEGPIILLERNAEYGQVDASVAGRNPYLGVFLPYTPLHHLILHEIGRPVVATSGNLSDEPICIDEHEAIAKLGGIADWFLIHNRPILHPVDDSIVRMIASRPMMLRRARGYAPLPIVVPGARGSVLAVGALFKNTVAASIGDRVYLSPHIGDLETEETFRSFERAISLFGEIQDFQPELLAHDLHPDFLSRQYADRNGVPTCGVQHHHAHVLACMADNEIEGPVLGVAWDGTGWGEDGTIWGGEFLVTEGAGFARVAHLRPFLLPGGDAAARQPWRSAMGVLYATLGEDLSSDSASRLFPDIDSLQISTVHQMLKQGLNCPTTTSAGRLFDAVAAIAGVRNVSRFEGQAAMELEFLTHGIQPDEAYPFRIEEKSVDWIPALKDIVKDRETVVESSMISIRFHNMLAEAIVEVARVANLERVVLTGGCFQNRYLTERAALRLREAGYRPYWHQRVPPNDGGIALGQVVAASLKEVR